MYKKSFRYINSNYASIKDNYIGQSIILCRAVHHF